MLFWKWDSLWWNQWSDVSMVFCVCLLAGARALLACKQDNMKLWCLGHQYFTWSMCQVLCKSRWAVFWEIWALVISQFLRWVQTFSPWVPGWGFLPEVWCWSVCQPQFKTQNCVLGQYESGKWNQTSSNVWLCWCIPGSCGWYKLQMGQVPIASQCAATSQNPAYNRSFLLPTPQDVFYLFFFSQTFFLIIALTPSSVALTSTF